MAVLDDRKAPSSQKADGDVVGTGEFPAGSSQMAKAIRRYQEKGGVFAAYEAGRLGFDLRHFLAGHGIDCRIIPAHPGVPSGEREEAQDGPAGRGAYRPYAEAGGSLGGEAAAGYTFRTGGRRRRGALSGAGRTWRTA
jgi:hypothetical protein